MKQFEKEMPNQVDAEAVILGSLIHFPGKLSEVMEALTPEDFWRDAHRTIYEVLIEYGRSHSGNGPDLMTLLDLVKGDDLDMVMEVKILRDELWSVDLEPCIKLVKAASIQRKFYYAAQDLAALSYGTADPEKLQQGAEKLFYSLLVDGHDSSDFDHIDDILGGCVDRLEEAFRNRGNPIGIATGYRDLDDMTTGFQRSDLIILGARPSVGKTSLGMNIAYNAAKAGHSVAVFSLEMSKEQLGQRLLSLVAQIPSNTLRSGWMKDGDWAKVVAARDHLSDLSIYIDDTSGSPISSIRSKLRRLITRTGRPVDFVVLDYLQLMEDEADSKRENRNQEVTRISRGLKAIAREFNVPVLALAQLSRAVETRQNKIPQLSDLRESGAIEQDGDIVMFLHREEMYNSETTRKGEADLIIAKQRNGPIGPIVLRFNGQLTSFSDLETTVGEDGDYASA